MARNTYIHDNVMRNSGSQAFRNGGTKSADGADWAGVTLDPMPQVLHDGIKAGKVEGQSAELKLCFKNNTIEITLAWPLPTWTWKRPVCSRPCSASGSRAPTLHCSCPSTTAPCRALPAVTAVNTAVLIVKPVCGSLRGSKKWLLCVGLLLAANLAVFAAFGAAGATGQPTAYVKSDGKTLLAVQGNTMVYALASALFTDYALKFRTHHPARRLRRLELQARRRAGLPHRHHHQQDVLLRPRPAEQRRPG